MIDLPNGCRMSDLAVYPKNWEKPTASLKKNWYIRYYFYDPAFKHLEEYKYGKRCIIKAGINRYKTLVERQDAVRKVLANELSLLKEGGYNPITDSHYDVIDEQAIVHEIPPSTLFIDALKEGLKRVKAVNGTLIDMKSVVRGVEKAAIQLRYIGTSISKISRKHIAIILEQCGRNNPRWSAHRHNKYRAYLKRIYKELVRLQAVDNNPLHDIDKMKETKNIRLTLTQEERIKIDKYLREKRYTFWRFMHIFFHSGGRETELMALKKEDVNLEKQQYKCLVKKGVQFK